ncbi:MAG: hypothetical protein Q9159_004247 [Coniocarpon cinnabarinum]
MDEAVVGGGERFFTEMSLTFLSSHGPSAPHWSFERPRVEPITISPPPAFLLSPSYPPMMAARSSRPFVPPSPQSLGKPQPAKHYPRARRWLRRLLYTSAAIGVLYLFDTRLYASALTRSLRTFAYGVLVSADYKINFRAHPPLARSVEDVHRRNAERLFELLRTNGGLYLKIGQALAMQSAVLPPEFQKMFSRMFDDAPQNEWKDVEQVIREDFNGRSPEEVFGVSFSGDDLSKGLMERTARASASVAQVHWARLPDGREVAVKIQKREIASQVGWDLWAFKVVARAYAWLFDLPLYSLVPYISERLMLETDFENEATNSEKMRDLVKSEPRLRDRVYIPKVFHELSSKRVMTAEWIEGVRLWDKASVEGDWRGGWRRGSPGSGGTTLQALSSNAAVSVTSNDPNNEKLKPERNEWRGRSGKGGLGLSMKQVMTTMVDLFSAQMFLWGLVHCDPHPGNIFVRRQPNGKPELVLIDHGLYIKMDPKFRHDYARFWKSLMTFDNNAIHEIVKGWGIESDTASDLFASATLLRPYEGGDNSTSKSIKKLEGKDEATQRFEMQQRMRQGIREILADEKKWPQELIFIGRNLRIVQGNNQFLGSPVNRIKITGNWASRALAESPDLKFSERFVNFGKGMEDDIEEQMRKMAKGMGVELQHGVFDG